MLVHDKAQLLVRMCYKFLYMDEIWGFKCCSKEVAGGSADVMFKSNVWH